jgi:HSP20 family protein
MPHDGPTRNGALTMLYRTLFPQDMLADLGRLQRSLQGTLDDSPGIRGASRSGYPAINVSSTPTAVEVLAFAPGIDPAAIDVQIDRGVLSISGERRETVTGKSPDDKTTLHLNERFAGRFRRVVSLPDDVDASAVTASYRDGVLHVSVPRRVATTARRIPVL